MKHGPRQQMQSVHHVSTVHPHAERRGLQQDAVPGLKAKCYRWLCWAGARWKNGAIMSLFSRDLRCNMHVSIWTTFAKIDIFWRKMVAKWCRARPKHPQTKLVQPSAAFLSPSLKFRAAFDHFGDAFWAPNRSKHRQRTQLKFKHRLGDYLSNFWLSLWGSFWSLLRLFWATRAKHSELWNQHAA